MSNTSDKVKKKLHDVAEKAKDAARNFDEEIRDAGR